MTTPKRNEAVARFVPAAYRQTGQTVVQMQPSHGVPGDHVDYVLYKDYAALQGEVSRLREDAEMFRWLTRYPNLYTVADLLKADQYVTLRRACEVLMLTARDTLEPPTDGR